MMEIRDAAEEAILTSGEFIRESFGSGERGGVNQKGSNDFVTGVDRQSERMIKSILLKHFPDIPFLAEESSERPDAGEFWVIDPLDGTTNFIHGYQQVGISIALVNEGDVVFGMVLDPLRGELFEATTGRGASCNGEAIEVTEATGLNNALIGTGFPFRAHQHLDAYLDIFRDVFSASSGVRRAGAAVLDLCHTAAGRLDGFWELYLMPWDMAAGSLIVTEAGGKVSDFFGRDSYLSSGNVIAGNNMVHNQLSGIIRKSVSSGQLDDLANRLMEREGG